MKTEEIQRFIDSRKGAENACLKITFKKRDPVLGIIVHCKDSADLETKNFWRVVSSANIEEWHSSKNISFSRLFNGHEFTKLAVIL